MTVHVSATINGVEQSFDVDDDERLVDLLRDRAVLTGTKEGCGIGECGACSVLVDGKLVASCMMLAAQADGTRIQTIEGAAKPDGSLSDLQRSFVRLGAVQCGYCTPGMVMAAQALLEQHSNPSPDQIRAAIGRPLLATSVAAPDTPRLSKRSRTRLQSGRASLDDHPLLQAGIKCDRATQKTQEGWQQWRGMREPVL
jgi:carbon-monoxide dehydrogenase small subunit